MFLLNTGVQLTGDELSQSRTMLLNRIQESRIQTSDETHANLTDVLMVCSGPCVQMMGEYMKQAITPSLLILLNSLLTNRQTIRRYTFPVSGRVVNRSIIFPFVNEVEIQV
jgi:hypothetical protein